MKENLSEVISDFIKNKKSQDAAAEVKDAEEIKVDIMQKLVQKKFGSAKKK